MCGHGAKARNENRKWCERLGLDKKIGEFNSELFC